MAAGQLKSKDALKESYNYAKRFFDDADLLKRQILDKTIIPHQVEIQPGPEKGQLCWLQCPYCYGGGAFDDQERLPLNRYLDVLQQIADGGVDKIIFAGYATDPLNYEHIDLLHRKVLENRQIFGFHTKALNISDQLISQITHAEIRPKSYFSVSLDAGSNRVYNQVHGIDGSNARLYERVCQNLTRIAGARAKNNSGLDLIVTYLLNRMNSSAAEVEKAIRDLKDAGVDLIRFSFPQVPRGYNLIENDPYIPDRKAVQLIKEEMKPIVEEENNDQCQVVLMDQDFDYNIVSRSRTTPCFSRFVFPTISFNGWLSHCSESASPHFNNMSIGDLRTHDFWTLFYDYDLDAFQDYLHNTAAKMKRYGCRCDRKGHVANDTIRDRFF